MDKTTLGNKLFKAVYKKQVTYKNGKWVSLGKDTTKLSNKNYINTDFSEAGISSFIEDANKLKISPKEVYDIGKMKEKGIDNVSYEDWLSESKILINKRNQSNMESKRPISIKLESRLRLKIRGIVENVMREEGGNTLPGNASFTVTESFKQMKQMMGVLESILKDKQVSPDTFWETYDNVVDSLRNKIEQMDTRVNKSRGGKLKEGQGSKDNIKKVLAQKGYGPIFQSIDKSYRDLKQSGYDRGEIMDTLQDMFGIDDPKIQDYLSKVR